jgi:Zn-dependent protease
MQWILQIPALFFAIIIHEFAHGYVAYRKGDDTAYLSGRLTLNPISHIDPIGTIILPAISLITGAPLIGWAKPVPVNPYNMNDPYRDMIWVSAAGPFANITLSFFSAVLISFFYLIGLNKFFIFLPFIYIFHYLVYINLILAFFNLFPLYPLDGGQILLNILPYRWREKYEKIIPYSMYIIIFLIITGLIRYWIFIPMEIILKFYSVIGLKIFPF